MRNKLLFCMIVAAALVLLAAVVVGAFGGTDRDRDDIGYNVLAEKIFEGTVVGRGYVMEGLVYFPLKTASKWEACFQSGSSRRGPQLTRDTGTPEALNS